MKNLLKLCLLILFSTAFPIIVWSSFNIFVLDNYDPKLGSIASLQVISLIYGAFGLISAISFTTSFYIVHKKNNLYLKNSILLSAIVIAVLLSFLSPFYFKYSMGELFGMIFGWAIVSFLVSLATFRLLNKETLFINLKGIS